MINKILWDLINTGKVASFIDNIIVGTEEEEGYDKVVEEVVKWLVENNLYVRPEKWKWNIKKVGFLKVVIRLEEIKIEEEKMKEVLDWLTPKGFKDIQKILELANCW